MPLRANWLVIFIGNALFLIPLYTLSRPNNKWSVRSFAARSSTGISKRSLNMEANGNKIEKTPRATEGQF